MVLRTAEGLELLPSAVTFIATLIAFALSLNPFSIATISFLAYVIAFLLTFFELYIIPGLPALGTVYSYISGYGIAFIILAGIGYLTSGLYGVVAFFLGRILAGFLCYLIDFIGAKQSYNKTGMML